MVFTEIRCGWCVVVDGVVIVFLCSALDSWEYGFYFDFENS